MTPEELQRARELCDTATRGPWYCRGASHDDFAPRSRVSWVASENDNVAIVPVGIKTHDAKFIAESRTLIPKLLDEIDRLRGKGEKR